MEDLIKNERHVEKIIPIDSSIGADENAVKVSNVINKKDLELKFDGCTRLVAMPNNRLLVMMENQSKYVIHFRFDQADLDVAAVDFIKLDVCPSVNKAISSPTSIIPSCIAIS